MTNNLILVVVTRYSSEVKVASEADLFVLFWALNFLETFSALVDYSETEIKGVYIQIR